jgi:hypothetical protein
MRAFNRERHFSNLSDDVDDLAAGVHGVSSDVELDAVGAVALFSARIHVVARGAGEVGARTSPSVDGAGGQPPNGRCVRPAPRLAVVDAVGAQAPSRTAAP